MEQLKKDNVQAVQSISYLASLVMLMIFGGAVDSDSSFIRQVVPAVLTIILIGIALICEVILKDLEEDVHIKAEKKAPRAGTRKSHKEKYLYCDYNERGEYRQ